jgi:hypothetical protein
MEFKKLNINFQAKSFTPTLNFGSNWGTEGGTSRFRNLGQIPEQRISESRLTGVSTTENQ